MNCSFDGLFQASTRHLRVLLRGPSVVPAAKSLQSNRQEKAGIRERRGRRMRLLRGDWRFDGMVAMTCLSG
jgi:hypothetical protein